MAATSDLGAFLTAAFSLALAAAFLGSASVALLPIAQIQKVEMRNQKNLILGFSKAAMNPKLK
jgi:hypothetical protein